MVSSTDRNVTRRHVVGTWNMEYGNEQVTEGTKCGTQK